MNWPAVGAALLAAGVLLGAFGAHGLRDRLDAYALAVWEKAVFYHFIHAAGLLVVPLLVRTNSVSAASANRVCWLLAGGVFVFSGSLYTLALTGQRSLGAITPLGGVAFIAAWLLLCVALLRSH